MGSEHLSAIATNSLGWERLCKLGGWRSMRAGREGEQLGEKTGAGQEESKLRTKVFRSPSNLAPTQ